MKLMVVSHPRSGSTTFARAISDAACNIVSGIGEMPYAHNDNWVMAKHEHVILYGKYKDVSLCTILRDPLDTISSNMDRWFKGYVGLVIHGIEIINSDIKSDHLEITDTMKNILDDSIDVYLAYLIAIDNSLDNLIVFTYDQIRNNPVESVNNILSMFGIDTQNYSHQDVINILSSPHSDKSVLYGEIRKYLEPKLDHVYHLYNQILEKVSLKQETYPVKLNPVIF